MKTLRNTLALILVGFLGGGCTFLDTEPQDFVSPGDYYNTQEQVESALLGVYATLASTSLYGNNMLGRMGLCADLGYEHYANDSGTVGYHASAASDTKILTYWRDLYNGIGRANLLLANMDKAPMTEAARNAIRGQALFLRAYYYFLLVVRFQHIPLILEVPQSMKEDLQVPQSDPRKIYDQIIRDMKEAGELVLPADKVECGGRVSQSAVYGILARVCLNFAGEPLREPGMYAEAKRYAQKVIDSGIHELNPSYEQVFINYMQDKYDIKESIFEVEFFGNNVGTYTTTAGMVGRNNGIALSSTSPMASELGHSIGAIRATEYFYSLFESEDLRRDWTIAPYTFISSTGAKSPIADTELWQRYCGKFRREYEVLKPKSNAYTPTNFPLLRYSDVLLMYAEGVAGDESATDQELTYAYELLNQVRRRGYGRPDLTKADPTVDFEKDSRENLLEIIKDERARELGHELLRKDDIVRWGEFYQRMKYIKNSIPTGPTYAFYLAARESFGNVTPRDVLWPIPSYEMGVNRKLQQNKGW